jgi:hypothetical protein
MSREHQQMRVRLPPDLKDNIERQAIKNGRSMNAEIVYRLQRSIEDDQVETGGIGHMEFRIVDPSIGKGPQKIFNALDEMEKILLNTKKMLEDAERDDDGESHNV